MRARLWIIVLSFPNTHLISFLTATSTLKKNHWWLHQGYSIFQYFFLFQSLFVFKVLCCFHRSLSLISLFWFVDLVPTSQASAQVKKAKAQSQSSKWFPFDFNACCCFIKSDTLLHVRTRCLLPCFSFYSVILPDAFKQTPSSGRKK